MVSHNLYLLILEYINQNFNFVVKCVKITNGISDVSETYADFKILKRKVVAMWLHLIIIGSYWYKHIMT
jgi:hypothetical protein